MKLEWLLPIFLASLISLTLPSVCLGEDAKQTDASYAEVGAVISQVKRELQAIQEVPVGDPKLELTDVTLEMSAIEVKNADGTFKILVPIVGASIGANAGVSTSSSHELTLVLFPSKPIITQSGHLSSDMEIANDIIAIRRQLAAGLNEEPVLLPKEFKFQVGFGVKFDAGAKGGGG